MKKTTFTFISLLICICGFCQEWTDEQLEKANTAADVQSLSYEEKQAIMYVNLARLFPKDFADIELQDDSYLNTLNPAYTHSLKDQLGKAQPVPALLFDLELYSSAHCFATESGIIGTVGHKRKKCRDEAYAECCSYGMSEGWDVALQWLIDPGVNDLGHRRICLNRIFTKIGISMHSHKRYGICAVAEFK